MVLLSNAWWVTLGGKKKRGWARLQKEQDKMAGKDSLVSSYYF